MKAYGEGIEVEIQESDCLKTLAISQRNLTSGGKLTGLKCHGDHLGAIDAGKKAITLFDHSRHIRELIQPPGVRLPRVYVAPVEVSEEVASLATRVETPRALVQWRKRGFAEVEMSLVVKEAIQEASRCLRCDLEFTQPQETAEQMMTVGGKSA